MYTEKELLQLAGKLAISCEALLNSNTKTIGFYINEIAKALDNYNNAIISNVNEES
jgi:hypothetical protein